MSLPERTKGASDDRKDIAARVLTPVAAKHLVKVRLRRLEKERRALIAQAATARTGLLSITNAIRKLRADDGFAVLLRAEDLEALPGCLARRHKPKQRNGDAAACVGDILRFVVATGYVARLLRNARCRRYLNSRHSESPLHTKQRDLCLNSLVTKGLDIQVTVF